MKHFRMPLNTATYRRLGSTTEYPPSRTQPNMALTIQEIYSRFVRQQPLPGVIDGFYINGDLSEYDNMNRIDKAQAAKTFKERTEILEANLLLNKQKAAQAEYKLKHESDVNKAVEAKLAELSEKDRGPSK